MPREHAVQVEYSSCLLITLEMLLNVPTGHTTVEKQTCLDAYGLPNILLMKPGGQSASKSVSSE